MLLQGCEDVILRQGSFLSPGREAGARGGAGLLWRPPYRQGMGTVTAPDCDPHSSDSLSPPHCPCPPASPRCTESLFEDCPEFTDVQAACVKIQCFIDTCTWRDVCVGSGGAGFGDVCCSLQRIAFPRGTSLGSDDAETAPLKTNSSPLPCGTGSPPQPPWRTPTAPQSEGS